MSLIEQIKAKQLEARKAKSPAVAVLTTLIGEATMIGKNDGNRETTDAEVIAVIKKFIKNIDDTMGMLTKDAPQAAEFAAEKNALKVFLPTQLDEVALRTVIVGIIAENGFVAKDMGKVMGMLKAQYGGTYDGQLASILVKKVLSK